jgi:2-pyrone-4,6-dicarboxylate lactonase
MDFPVCDCHVHVFDPKRFAYVTTRRFTPDEATVAQLKSNLEKVGISNVVLVQPSVYGEDNSCLLSALKELGSTARGVAVVSEHTSSEEMVELQEAGVRGARLNLVVDSFEEPSLALNKLIAIEENIPSDWHVQLHVSQSVLGALASHISQSNRIYVLDHMGLPDVASGHKANNWLQLIELMKSSRLYIKVSAPYLFSRIPTLYTDVEPFVQSLINTRSDRVLWGSNWPHTQGTNRNKDINPESIETFRNIDNPAWLYICKKWFGTDSLAVLSENSKNLYGYQ